MVAGHHHEPVRPGGPISDFDNERLQRRIQRLDGALFGARVFLMRGHVRGLGMYVHELVALCEEVVRQAQLFAEVRDDIG